MQRMRDERGAVGVVVALLMVPLIGLAAIAIDVSAMYAERQQLQTGADAGALAVAQDCARGACGLTGQTAQTFATSNLPNAVSTATVTSLTPSEVTVRNAGIKQHWFAQVLGVPTSSISASATVAWGGPTGGTMVLPLAFSQCEWKKQNGTAAPWGTTGEILYLTKTSPSLITPDCTGPSGNVVPGGFGWVTTNPGTCQTSSIIGAMLHSDPGNSVPSGCSTGDFTAMVGNTVLLPIFDSYAGTGSNATYRVYGYAAFVLTGYRFGGQYNTNPAPCSGNERCIAGYFTHFVDISDAFTYDAGTPQLGASVVRLTN